jgi:hypothetical protein
MALRHQPAEIERYRPQDSRNVGPREIVVHFDSGIETCGQLRMENT